MGNRKVKDAKDLDTGEKIYLKSHAKATYMSNGKSIEDALNDGDFLTKESADALYQPQGNYLTSIPDNYVTEDELNIPLENHGTGDIIFELTPNVYHVWSEVPSLTLTLANVTDSSIYNEYMFEFTSGSTATSLSLPIEIAWVTEPIVDANKKYQCSIVNNIGVIASVDNS